MIFCVGQMGYCDNMPNRAELFTKNIKLIKAVELTVHYLYKINVLNEAVTCNGK